MIPTSMSFNNQQVNPNNLPDTFAQFFQNKVQSIINEQTIDQNVYNGKLKLNAPEQDFMTESDVITAINS